MKTKFFRVAVEGATTDGRQIEKQWLLDAAATYNRETYAARVNMEHIRGITADRPFKAYGDVISLKTENVQIELAGKTETRLALFAELDVTDELVAINRDKQKLYTSIEISPNFANTGKAYLVGLAVTDSPASLGTELLQFVASQSPEINPFASRKQDPANLFTAAEEVSLELVEEAPAETTTGLLSAIKDALVKLTAPAAPPVPEPAKPAAPAAAADPAAQFAAVTEAMTQLATGVDGAVTKLTAKVAQLTTDLAALKTERENTPAPGFTQRPVATGGPGDAKTDC